MQYHNVNAGKTASGVPITWLSDDHLIEFSEVLRAAAFVAIVMSIIPVVVVIINILVISRYWYWKKSGIKTADRMSRPQNAI